MFGLLWKLGRDLLINILYSGGAYSLKEIREWLLCNYFWGGNGLIGILENIRATLKMGRSLFEIMFIWWEGLFIKRNNRGAYWKILLEEERT